MKTSSWFINVWPFCSTFVERLFFVMSFSPQVLLSVNITQVVKSRATLKIQSRWFFLQRCYNQVPSQRVMMLSSCFDCPRRARPCGLIVKRDLPSLLFVKTDITAITIYHTNNQVLVSCCTILPCYILYTAAETVPALFSTVWYDKLLFMLNICLC